MSPVKIFVSYSHRDARHLEAEGLLGFLRGLERDLPVSFWVDDALQAGAHWDATIARALGESHIALLLVSQAFLDSTYCQQVEVRAFLDQQQRAGLRLFPVVLSACEWERHGWLAACQMLPGGQETLEENYCEPGQQKRLFLRVRQQLRALIEQVAEQLSQPAAAAERPAEVNAELRTVTLLQAGLSVDRLRYGLSAGEELEFLYEAAPLFKERCISELELLDGFVVQMSDAGRVLACFGYPEAQELDSVKAVRAGLALVRATARLNERLQAEWSAQLTVRVGVHTGRVIGKTGADTQQQLEHGPASALTSQVMRAAGPDAVLVSQSTQALVADFFTLAPAAPLPARPGEDEGGLGLWTVTADGGLNSRFEAAASRRIPLVGRQGELDLMLERWQMAAVGKGQMVVVSAEAGLGKSRLIQELNQTVVRNGHRVLHCQCSVFTRNTPLFPIIQLLERRLHIQADDSEADKLRKLVSGVTQLDLPAEEVVPYLAELLGVPHAQPAGLAQLTPQQLKERTFEAVLAVMVQMAALTPIMLVVEDLHWADNATLECLGQLVEELPAARLCVVASARPEFAVPPHWQAQNYFALITLDPLTHDKVTELMERLTGGKGLPREVLAAICHKAEGCPLFIEEFTLMVLASGQLTEHHGRLVLARPLTPLAIPDTLLESLMARLHKLEGGRTIAQIGAVLGREFSLELLQAVAPLEPAALKELLARLVHAGLLYRRGLLTRSVYLFKHALVQDALYESLLGKERKRYHRLAAQALVTAGSQQGELLAHHFRRAELPEPALAWGLRAAQHAAAAAAHPAVLHHVSEALRCLRQLPDAPARRATERQLLLLQGPALLALKGISAPETGNAYLQAKALHPADGDQRELFRINRGLWAHYMVSSQLEESLRIAAQLMALAEARDDNDCRLEAHACFCDSYFWQGQPQRALHHAELGLAFYDCAAHHLPHALEFGEDPAAVMLTYSLSVLALSQAPAERLAARLAQLERHLDLFSHAFSKGFLLYGLSLYYAHLDNPEQALRYGGQLKALAQQHDQLQWLALGQIFHGWGRVRLHGEADGVDEILTGIASFAGGGGVVTTGISAYLAADAYCHLHQPAPALALLERTLAFLDTVEERHYYSELLRCQARLRQQLHPDQPEGDAQTRELLRRAHAIAQQQQLPLLLRRLPQPEEVAAEAEPA